MNKNGTNKMPSATAAGLASYQKPLNPRVDNTHTTPTMAANPASGTLKLLEVAPRPGPGPSRPASRPAPPAPAHPLARARDEDMLQYIHHTLSKSDIFIEWFIEHAMHGESSWTKECGGDLGRLDNAISKRLKTELSKLEANLRYCQSHKDYEGHQLRVRVLFTRRKTYDQAPGKEQRATVGQWSIAIHHQDHKDDNITKALGHLNLQESHRKTVGELCETFVKTDCKDATKPTEGRFGTYSQYFLTVAAIFARRGGLEYLWHNQARSDTLSAHGFYGSFGEFVLHEGCWPSELTEHTKTLPSKLYVNLYHMLDVGTGLIPTTSPAYLTLIQNLRMSKLHLSSTVVSMGYDTTNRSTQYQLQLSLHHMPEDGSIRRSPLWSCLLKMAATWIFKSGSIVHQSNSCEAQIQRNHRETALVGHHLDWTKVEGEALSIAKVIARAAGHWTMEVKEM